MLVLVCRETAADAGQISDKPDTPSDLAGSVSFTGAGFRPSVEFASLSIQQKWGCELVKLTTYLSNEGNPGTLGIRNDRGFKN